MSDSDSERRRFGYSGIRSDLKKPVEEGEDYEADIEDISRRGDGIAKIEGFVIFIPNTKKGEHVRFRVTKVGNRFAIGELAQS